MTDGETSVEHLIHECKTIEESSLYNAQAHFSLSDNAENKARALLIVPSAVAGVCGILTAVGLPAWIGALSAVGGFLTAVASGLGVDRIPTAHRIAANQWTALRQEARSLHEAYAKELTHSQL